MLNIDLCLVVFGVERFCVVWIVVVLFVWRMRVMEQGTSQYMCGITDMDQEIRIKFFFSLVDCVDCLVHWDTNEVYDYWNNIVKIMPYCC
jgi:hypothetical protein